MELRVDLFERRRFFESLVVQRGFKPGGGMSLRGLRFQLQVVFRDFVERRMGGVVFEEVYFALRL